MSSGGVIWRWRESGVPSESMNFLTRVALGLSPVLANAGVLYDLTVRPVDQSNLTHVSPGVPAATSAVTEYFVEDGKVRIGGAYAKRVFVIKDRTIYVIDHTSRTVHVLRRATLSDVAAHYADVVKQLEEAAASAPAEERAEAQRKAAAMSEASERMRQPMPRDYRVTVRIESVDGHTCRIWEEREKGAKRLELCVAPAAAVPGGAEIYAGLKTLSQFRQGSDVALGVDFGLSEWWADFASLGGIPLLVREFKYDSVVAEVTFTAERAGVPGASLLDMPDGYPVQEGPDYAQWYTR
jgi:hypothetical protein